MRLLDTNIVSYFMRSDPLAGEYITLLADHPRAISFMTLAELHEGADRAKWGTKRMMFLEQEIAKYILCPWTPEICTRWADVRFARRKQPISAQDAFIAATALVHGCPLVTHNAVDFRGISGLKVITTS